MVRQVGRSAARRGEGCSCDAARRLPYYVNAVGRVQDRYEDYIVQDLVADAETRLPIASERGKRAIAGISMGGFGAMKIALSHPERYVFAGALSPAMDVPHRPFSAKRTAQWWALRSIFDPAGSEVRRSRDPFFIARSLHPHDAPYLFITCGESESLLPSNRAFAATLAKQHLPHEFHIMPGGHEWNQWNRQLPKLLHSLLEHLSAG